MHDLSILCVTKAERCVLPLLETLSLVSRLSGSQFVLVADGQEAFKTIAYNPMSGLDPDRLFRIDSKGYIESVLDSCIGLTTGKYIFRVDDDESLPLPVVEWLKSGGYRESDHWKFNRAHLIARGNAETGDGETRVITNQPLWPDHQTRLSTREKSFGRNHIHCGSPHGGGDLAPYPIIHHKFVIKSREEREAILKRYDEIQPGAGGGFWQFSVPERMEERRDGRIETISYDEFVRRGYTV